MPLLVNAAACSFVEAAQEAAASTYKHSSLSPRSRLFVGGGCVVRSARAQTRRASDDCNDCSAALFGLDTGRSGRRRTHGCGRACLVVVDPVAKLRIWDPTSSNLHTYLVESVHHPGQEHLGGSCLAHGGDRRGTWPAGRMHRFWSTNVSGSRSVHCVPPRSADPIFLTRPVFLTGRF